MNRSDSMANTEEKDGIAVRSGQSPGTRARSKAGIEQAVDSSPAPIGLQFPFLDSMEDSNTSRSFDLHLSPGKDIFASPPGHKKANSTELTAEMGSELEWEAEISPIAKIRESDASGGTILRVSSSSENMMEADLVSEGKLGALEQSSYPKETQSQLATLSDETERNSSTTPSQETETLKKSMSDANHEAQCEVSDNHSEVKTPIQQRSSSGNNPSESEDDDLQSSDLTSARKQVGQSSNEFNERIRSAAHRRKVAMSRSRDSLVAKEREQRSIKAQSVIVEEAASEDDSETNHDYRRNSNSEAPRKQFKARPLPETTGVKGTGGLDGVPKIEKKPTTTPFSPRLGSRRPQKTKVKCLENSKPKQPQPRETKPSNKNKETLSMPAEKGVAASFKARPVPSSVGMTGYGGQFGVPKVPKRPVTVPHSPLLGPRRRSKSVDKPTQSKQTRHSTSRDLPPRRSSLSSQLLSSKIKSPKVVDSPDLLGLKILDMTPDPKQNPLSNDENLTPSNSQIKPYQPHSTIRAKKRADFDARRNSTFQIKMEHERQRREKEIRKMRRELQTLGKELV